MTDITPCPTCSTPAAPVSHSPARVQRHTATLAAAAAHVAAGGVLVGMACETMERSDDMANVRSETVAQLMARYGYTWLAGRADRFIPVDAAPGARPTYNIRQNYANAPTVSFASRRNLERWLRAGADRMDNAGLRAH